MIRITAVAAALLALSGTLFAQESLPDPGNDAARQARMNEAYQHAPHPGPVDRAESATKRDARDAGHSIHRGLQKTGHAIRHGAHETGEAISNGVHKTGHAIHRGADKVTGHP